MSALRHAYEESALREIACWPGVEARFGHGGKHPRIVLSFRGSERVVSYPCSPSDTVRGPLMFVADLRKALRALGATRTAAAPPKPKERKRRQRIERHTTLPTISDPRPDGFAALRELKARMDAPKPAPVTFKFRNPLLPLAVALVQLGRSFGEAAKEVGRGLTRNAVAGACHRAGVKAPMDERKRVKARGGFRRIA